MSKKEESKSSVSLSQVFKRIIWPRRKMVFVGLILIVVSRAASLVLPYISKELIDVVVPAKDMGMLYTILGIVVGALFIQSLFGFL